MKNQTVIVSERSSSSNFSDFLKQLKVPVATTTIVKTTITTMMYPSNFPADENSTSSLFSVADFAVVKICDVVVNSFSSER